MATEQLKGGFINRVERTNGHVVKDYRNGYLKTGIPDLQRQQRESIALRIFGGRIAPKLLHEEPLTTHQEFVEGGSYEQKFLEGEDVLREAGSLLKQIHVPVTRPLQYLIDDYHARLQRYYQKALPILVTAGVDPILIEPNWNEVTKLGTTRVHRDFWLANIMGTNGTSKVIDWEFSGIGSPYEDFAISDLWIFREYGGRDQFYRGYGLVPDQRSVDAYLQQRCLQFLSTCTPEAFRLEPDDGFYHNKIVTIKNISHDNTK